MATDEGWQIAEHPAQILISSQRKPISYLGQCKKHLSEHGEVLLSGLGIAISSLTSVAEILRSKDLATEKKLRTTLEVLNDAGRNRQKPRMDILMVKSAKFDELVAAEQAAAASSGDAPAAEAAEEAAA